MRSACVLLFSVVSLAAGAAQVAVTSGYATNAGPNAQIVPSGSPLLSAPQMTFVNVSESPVGATNATGNNVAGASNSTIMKVPGLGAASTSMPVYMSSPGTSPVGVQQETPGMPPEMRPGAQMPQQNQAEQGAPLLRLGALRMDSAYNTLGPPPGVPSLAQVAPRSSMQQAGSQNVRTYTNQDIERLNQQSGMKPSGTTPPTPTSNQGGAAASAEAVAALNRNLGVTESNTPAVGALNRNLGIETEPSATAETSSHEGENANEQHENQSGEAAAMPDESWAESTQTAENGSNDESLTQQIRREAAMPERGRATGQETASNRLPTTASPLPLLALLSLLAGGTGLWLRK